MKKKYKKLKNTSAVTETTEPNKDNMALNKWVEFLNKTIWRSELFILYRVFDKQVDHYKRAKRKLRNLQMVMYGIIGIMLIVAGFMCYNSPDYSRHANIIGMTGLGLGIVTQMIYLAISEVLNSLIFSSNIAAEAANDRLKELQEAN